MDGYVNKNVFMYLLMGLISLSTLTQAMGPGACASATPALFSLGALLKNPTRVLTFAQRFYEQTEKKQEALLAEQKGAEIEALYKQVGSMCPIFLLGECICDDQASPCPLSRIHNPTYRATFEQAVVGALCTAAAPGHAISYVDFGCGGMFQTLVILARFLAQKPTATIVVHLIDPQLTRYVLPRDILNIPAENPHLMLPGQYIDITPILDGLIHEYRAQRPEDRASNEELVFNFKTTFFIREAMAQQLLSYLTHTFSDAHISLVLHANVNSSLEYIKDHALPYPDVISAADTQDPHSLERGAAMDYTKLCITCLQQNPTATNIFLARSDKDTPIHLETIRLPEHEHEAGTHMFADRDGSLTPYYIVKQEIPS